MTECALADLTAEQRANATPLVALYDYKPPQDDQRLLQLVQGEEVFGIKLQGDWWEGFNDKRTGLFPANYVEPTKKPVDKEEQEELPKSNEQMEAITQKQTIHIYNEQMEAITQKQTIQSIHGLNLQWAIADNLRFGHTMYLWNGNFSSFTVVKLLLTDNFLIEAAFFTEDLPELTVYPLYKLYIDPKQVIEKSLFKRGYLMIRSMYYFRNMSTTAQGGKHNVLFKELRERLYTYTKASRKDGMKGVSFLRKLLNSIVQAKEQLEQRLVQHMLTLKGYNLLYDEHPPHFDRKVKDLVFAKEILPMEEDSMIAYDDFKFLLKGKGKNS